MKINYNDSKIEKLCTNRDYALRKMDRIVYNRLSATINFIENANSLLDIKNYPSFNFHDLEGKYKGQWTIYIGKTGYRLHIIPQTDDNKTIAKGDVIPSIKTIKVMLIMEVSNHYGE